MERPVSVVVCFSGSASSFRYLVQRDPNHGKLYTFVGAFSDMPGCKGVEFAKKAGIPTASLDFPAWCGKRGVRRSDLAAREVYFQEALDLIAPWQPEAIMLSGFMLIVTEPWLSRFEGRMLNVHPAFLSIHDPAGARKYTGLHVVERAMKAGDPTGSTVHLLTREPDRGPIVAESDALPYEKGADPDAHQERMKTECDGPAFQDAFKKLITAGWPHRPWQAV